MILRCLILCGVLLFPVSAWAQYEELTVREVYGLGVEAYNEGDAQGFLAAMAELNRRRPYQFSVQYNYTIALAGAGEMEAAISQLERIADLGLSIDLSADEDFAPLYDHPRYGLLSARLLLNNEAEGSSATVHTFEVTDVLAEGIAVDEVTGDVYASTVRSGEIYRRNTDGDVAVFADGTAHGSLAGILGMAIDQDRGLLWAASSTPGLYRGANDSAETGSALLAFDLATGAVRHAYLLGEGNHFLGDVVISPSREVYASDSGSPALYRVGPNLDVLERIDLSADLMNVQGFDFAPDGRIYVADYVLGLFVMARDGSELRRLEVSSGVNPTGVDGLFFRDGDLIGIQNATNPKRIVRFNLSADGNTVEGLDVLVTNHPLWDEPTLGQVIGDQLLYMATAEWPDFDADGMRREGTEMHPIRIMSVDLN